MREKVSEVPVIGEEEESLCIEIEATHRINSRFHIFKKIHNGRSSLRIFNRGKVPPGFIEEKDHFGFKGSEPLSIHFDVIFGGIGLETQCLNDLAIDRHPSFDHHPLRFPPRSDPSLGQNFLNTFHFQSNTLLFSLIHGEVLGRGYPLFSLSHPISNDLSGGYLLRRWRGLNFFEGGEIGECIKAKELKKGFGGSIDDGPSRKIFSTHHLDQPPFQEGTEDRPRIHSTNLLDRRPDDGLTIGNDG